MNKNYFYLPETKYHILAGNFILANNIKFIYSWRWILARNVKTSKNVFGSSWINFFYFLTVISILMKLERKKYLCSKMFWNKRNILRFLFHYSSYDKYIKHMANIFLGSTKIGFPFQEHIHSNKLKHSLVYSQNPLWTWVIHLLLQFRLTVFSLSFSVKNITTFYSCRARFHLKKFRQ